MSNTPVEITTADGVVDAHVFRPEGQGPWPGVLMLTDIFGVTPNFEKMGQRLADAGFVVLLPNLYYRVAKAPLQMPPGDFQDAAFREHVGKLRMSLTRERMLADIGAYLQALTAEAGVKSGRFGVVGYCMTGSMAVRAAADFPDQIGVAASFHGGGLASDAPDSPHLMADKIHARVLLGYAVEDASMPVEMIEKLEAAFKAAGVNFNSETYEGKHGFAVYGARAYDQAAAEHHWDRLIAELKAGLGG